jgi:hypothetical protein
MTIMETRFYLVVRLIAAIYILYKIWNLLFRKPAAPLPKPLPSIMGVSKTVLIHSTCLDPTDYIGSEEPPLPDDVESPEPSYVPSEDELYDNTSPPDENEISSGVVFEELVDAADVILRGTTDESRRAKAAKTLYKVRDTEIMDLLVGEVFSADAIDSLFRECLDGNGLPRSKRQITEFDMNKYV